MSKTRRSDPDLEFDVESIDEAALLEGLVVDGGRGNYRVETPEGTLRCEIRGRLRKRLSYAKSSGTTLRDSAQRARAQTLDPVAVGDRVRVLVTGRGAGTIEEVIERAGGAFVR